MNKLCNKILVIDDNKDNLIILADSINHAFEGYTTLKASTGRKGLALAAAEHPDVILLDLIMPGMDGFEVCKKLKSDPRTQSIPVVFLTARRGDNQSRIRAMEAGADAFLARPIDEMELVAQIRAMQKVKQATLQLIGERDELARLVSEQTRELEQTHTATLNLLEDLQSENEARKKNEAALRLSEEALRKSEGKFRAVVENSNEGILFGDEQANIVYRSPSYIRLNGFSDQERLGHSGFETVHPDDLQILRSYWEKLIKDPEYSGRAEYRIRHKDGRWIWVETSGQNLLNNPDVRSIIITSRDITERRLVDEEIHRLNASLERRVEERTYQLQDAQEKLIRQEKLATLGQLAGGVGHELRNPLGVINSSVYYLKLILPDASEKVKQHLAMIEQEVQIAARIIGDLLDYGRVITPDRQKISVTQLIQASLERFPVLPAIQLSLHIPPNLPYVFADPLHMEQVLGNLTMNASQAMLSKDGTLGGQLTISARQATRSQASEFDGDMLVITVKDTGSGINPDNMAKLFEPLFTTKTRGIGLGLAVSRKLVQANGGTIKVISEVGKGSSFSVFLPIFRAESLQ